MDDTADYTTVLKSASAADPDLGDLAGLLQLWESRCKEGLLPARGDFDPLDLKKFLGRIVLFDVLENPRRFRFRLVGTDWVLRFGLDPTNTLVDDFPRAQSRPFINEVLGKAVDGRAPLWVRRAILIEGRYYHYGMLLMPLSADGKSVNMIMAGFDLEI
ncbi:PAS domain-containing protein [Dongia sp. agr-C8]